MFGTACRDDAPDLPVGEGVLFFDGVVLLAGGEFFDGGLVFGGSLPVPPCENTNARPITINKQSANVRRVIIISKSILILRPSWLEIFSSVPPDIAHSAFRFHQSKTFGKWISLRIFQWDYFIAAFVYVATFVI